MKFREKLNVLHESSKAKLLYAQPEGNQLAVDVLYNGQKYGGYIPKLK